MSYEGTKSSLCYSSPRISVQPLITTYLPFPGVFHDQFINSPILVAAEIVKNNDSKYGIIGTT